MARKKKSRLSSLFVIPSAATGNRLLDTLILVAKSKSEERYHKKGLFSLLGGEYQPSLMLEKKRTFVRKSNFPPVSARMESHSVLSLDTSLLRFSCRRMDRKEKAFTREELKATNSRVRF
jgi:hypothetical protein